MEHPQGYTPKNPQPGDSKMTNTPPTNGKEIRALCRTGQWTGPTAGVAPGFVQANLVILPKAFAYDFLLFCQRNPKPCPLLEVLNEGSPIPLSTCKGADIRSDLPKYRIFDHGVLSQEITDITPLWKADLVTFLLGCSFTFDAALQSAGVPVRHEQEKKNVPMYRTSIPCKSAGMFHGPLVVSMRPMLPAEGLRACQITGKFPRAHGSPVHLGDPTLIGIPDLAKPDFGDAVTLKPGEVPVFWACGVTPQAVAVASQVPFLITHSPGHMLVSDWKDQDLEGEERIY